MKKFTKIMSVLMVLAMVLGMAACGAKTDSTATTAAPAETTAAPTETTAAPVEAVEVPGADATDDELYDYVLGDYYEAYMKALDSMDMSERYALEAIAEAKLLQIGRASCRERV